MKTSDKECGDGSEESITHPLTDQQNPTMMSMAESEQVMNDMHEMDIDQQQQQQEEEQEEQEQQDDDDDETNDKDDDPSESSGKCDHPSPSPSSGPLTR